MAEFNHDDHNSTQEEFCYMCRRSERSAGKLIRIQGMFALCPDCMQKTFDMMMDGSVPGLLPMPGFMFSQQQMQDMLTMQQKGKNPEAKAESEAAKALADEQTAANTEAECPSKENASEAETTTDSGENQTKKAEEPTGPQIHYGNGPYPGMPSFIEISGITPDQLGSESFQQNLMSMLGGALPEQKKVKKRAKGEKIEPIIDLSKIPAPHKIREMLDTYVVGQDYAKKVISVGVYNHYKRVAAATVADDNSVEIEKSNILMIGPTGCGKTFLVQTLARILEVPLAIADATSLTEAGYIGDDIESVLSKLLAAADNDVDRAEKGIVFIDEIDKLARKRNTNSRDVSGESVQQGLLKLLEGSEVEVPVGATSKNAMVPLTTMNTKDILFICGGAFPDLEDIIKERLTKTSTMGFTGELKDRFDEDRNLIRQVETEDLRLFGMIPEFLGRLPIVCSLSPLDEQMMINILTKPKNAIIRQYQKLLQLDEVDLVFEEDALDAIAKKAMKKDIGARALRAIIEDLMLDIMYEIPKDSMIGRVIVTKDYVERLGSPRIELRDTLTQ